MTELEKKLETAKKLQLEIKEAHQAIALKSGMMNDLMKDIATTHLGFKKEDTEYDLADLLQKTYQAGSIR